MQPLIVLIVLFLAFSVLSRLAIPSAFGWYAALRLALAGMFLLTSSAARHIGRSDGPTLFGWVPPVLPRPDLLVTLTGILEFLGAIGLMILSIAPYAAIGLFLMLLAMFPANVDAARERLAIGGGGP
jgi:uncharacterized membrane protein